MPLDPTKHADWEIAEAAEAHMKTVYQLGEELGLEKQELLPHGHYVAKVDFKNVLARLSKKADGKYIDVTAITPTPLGEGKINNNHWFNRRARQEGKECYSSHTSAVRRTNNEYQRLCSRRRAGTVRAADTVFLRA